MRSFSSYSSSQSLIRRYHHRYHQRNLRLFTFCSCVCQSDAFEILLPAKRPIWAKRNSYCLLAISCVTRASRPSNGRQLSAHKSINAIQSFDSLNSVWCPIGIADVTFNFVDSSTHWITTHPWCAKEIYKHPVQLVRSEYFDTQFNHFN